MMKKAFLWAAAVVVVAWVMGCSGEVETKTVTETVTETVEVEKPATYSVVFLPNGADGDVVTQSFVVGTTQNLKANGFSRAGFSFAGWNTKSDGSGTDYADGASVKDLASENGAAFLLYAKWSKNGGTGDDSGDGDTTTPETPKTYTVIFIPNGASESVMTQVFAVGEEKTLTQNAFVREGFDFTGWNTSANGTGTSYADGASVKNLATKDGAIYMLYAQWEDNGTTAPDAQVFYVTFRANGGNGTMNDQTFVLHKEQEIRNCTFTPQTGYKFSHWNTQADDSGTRYEAKQSVNNLSYTENVTVTLYAIWSPIRYTILFDSNGGKGTTEPLSVLYDEEATIRENGFTRATSVFIAWNTQADGSGAKYEAGEKVKNLTATDGEVITLYAQWNVTGAISVTPPTYSDMGDVSAEVDGNKITFSAPEGFKTYAWYIDDEAQTEANGKATWTLDVSDTTKWKARNYFVLVLVTDENGKTLSAGYELAITK